MEQNTVQKPDCAAITAQARQAAESRSRLGSPALRAELASILAWLDI